MPINSGKLCDYWAKECGGDYKTLKFEAETNEDVCSNENLYKMMLKCGSFTASRATKRLILRAITEESREDELFGQMNAMLDVSGQFDWLRV